MQRISLITIMAACTIVGCDSQSAVPAKTSPPPTFPSSTTPAAVPATEFTPILLIQLNKIEGEGETTEYTHTFENPDPVSIAEQVKALDWGNPKYRYAAWIAWKMTAREQGDAIDRKGKMVIDGGFKTPNKDGPLRATWQSPESLRSPPLESLEQAIALLVSFSKEDGKWKTAVQWKSLR